VIHIHFLFIRREIVQVAHSEIPISWKAILVATQSPESPANPPCQPASYIMRRS